jgi:hypothetical protein
MNALKAVAGAIAISGASFTAAVWSSAVHADVFVEVSFALQGQLDGIPPHEIDEEGLSVHRFGFFNDYSLSCKDGAVVGHVLPSRAELPEDNAQLICQKIS